MSEFNGGSENRNFERLDRMDAQIQGLIQLAHDQSRNFAEIIDVIRESRLEIQELITLQKEHRIDIMALFQVNKDLRESLRDQPKGNT